MTKQETEMPQVIGVGHVALSSRNPAVLADFYRDVLGFQVVPTETSDLGENVFLSSRPSGSVRSMGPPWRGRQSIPVDQ
jgi:catechol-2,3-dioxygenase